MAKSTIPPGKSSPHNGERNSIITNTDANIASKMYKDYSERIGNNNQNKFAVQHLAEAVSKAQKDMLVLEKKYQAERLKMSSQVAKEMKDATENEIQAEVTKRIKATEVGKELLKQRAKASKEHHELEIRQIENWKRIQESAAKQVQEARAFLYDEASDDKKIKMLEQNISGYVKTIADAEAEAAEEIAIARTNYSGEKALEEEKKALDKYRQLQQNIGKEKVRDLLQINKVAQKHTEEQYKLEKKNKANLFSFLAKGDSEASKNRLKNIEAEKEAAIKAAEEAAKIGDEKGKQEAIKAYKDAVGAQNRENANQALAKGAGLVSDKINQYAEAANTSFAEYMGKVDARMQGTDKTYSKMTDLISTNLSVSPFVQVQRVMEQLQQGATQGIAYNLEQRAFLNTIKDKIAHTFDSFDSNLMRIVKIQQADSTVARLGMEASLTKFYNRMYEDSQYLNSLFDSVSGAIVDATSQLSREASTEFEYVVQKWLGSLSSVGVSDSAISSIASGLNMLGSGNATGLANNSSLQVLLAMSAAKSGQSYADLLLNGLNADNTNLLMINMIKYLRDVFSGSDNNVVKSAYASIFNLSMSDMKAITNLSNDRLSNVFDTMMNYSSMENETSNQLNQVIKRTTIPVMLQNLYENALYGVAYDQAQSPLLFGMKSMLDFMRSTNTDVIIPAVSAMGTGINLNGTSVQDLLGIGMMGAQGLLLMGNILKGLTSGGGMNLNSWNARETISSGKFSLSPLDLLLGEKSGAYAVSSNSEDMENTAIANQSEDAKRQGEAINGSTAPEKTFVDIVNGSGEDYVRAILFDEEGTSAKINRDGTLSVVDNALLKLVGDINAKITDPAKARTGKEYNEMFNNGQYYVPNQRAQVVLSQLEKATSPEEYLIMGLLTGAFRIAVNNVEDEPLKVAMDLDSSSGSSSDFMNINSYIVN